MCVYSKNNIYIPILYILFFYIWQCHWWSLLRSFRTRWSTTFATTSSCSCRARVWGCWAYWVCKPWGWNPARSVAWGRKLGWEQEISHDGWAISGWAPSSVPYETCSTPWSSWDNFWNTLIASRWSWVLECKRWWLPKLQTACRWCWWPRTLRCHVSTTGGFEWKGNLHAHQPSFQEKARWNLHPRWQVEQSLEWCWWGRPWWDLQHVRESWIPKGQVWPNLTYVCIIFYILSLFNHQLLLNNFMNLQELSYTTGFPWVPCQPIIPLA